MSEPIYPSAPILLIDDEESWLRNLKLLLRGAGMTNVISCQSGKEALNILRTRKIAVATLDLNMPQMKGDELLEIMAKEFPQLLVIMVTGANQVDMAVRCVKLGAAEYFVKSNETERLISGIRRSVELWELNQENQLLKEQLLQHRPARPEAFNNFITRNARVTSLFRYLEAVAPSVQPVLITGESGTGKELIAQAVHRLSGRPGEFVAVNTAGLDDNVFSDTLFGHRKGAFTGASTARPGMVERAKGGTLFLDEIGDLNTSCQVKLLRLLQEREFLPLGSDVPKQSEARVLVATHRDLRSLVEQGEFRKDLFFRLSTHTVAIPALRDRKDDLPLLLDHFLEKAAQDLGKTKPTAPPQLATLLRTYSFPGNVRELESMVFDAVSLHTSKVLSMDSFKNRMAQEMSDSGPVAEPESDSPGVWANFSDPLPTFTEADALLVSEAMKRADNNQTIAAQMLGVTRQALNRRLQQQRKES